MCAPIIVSTMLIYPWIVGGQFASWLHCLINLVVVMCICIFHFSVSTS